MDYDYKTTRYFDTHVPQYPIPPQLMEVMREYVKKGFSVIDIGAGTGDTLEMLYKDLSVTDLHALDVSGDSLRIAQNRCNCIIHQGSITESNSVIDISNTFDVAILKSVLHHLIGRTRKDSKRLAIRALYNSLRLLKQGGFLIIWEPCFYPQISMDVVFYVKKFFSIFTKNRIEIFNALNNIGNPVVSYYTMEQLAGWLSALEGSKILKKQVIPRKINKLLQITMVSEASSSIFVIEKT